MPLTMHCPFWKRETEKKSICEGCTLRFASEEERQAYYLKYCANEAGWNNCTVARSLDISYELGIRT